MIAFLEAAESSGAVLCCFREGCTGCWRWHCVSRKEGVEMGRFPSCCGYAALVWLALSYEIHPQLWRPVWISALAAKCQLYFIQKNPKAEVQRALLWDSGS